MNFFVLETVREVWWTRESEVKDGLAIRAKVEHPIRVIKRQFGHVEVRYRGLYKNTAQLVTLFALSNLWVTRKTLFSEMMG